MRAPSHPKFWPPATDALLRALWADGLSITAIGKEIGRTRNSVVGRARRLGLPPRGSPILLRSNKPRPPRRTVDKWSRGVTLAGVQKVAQALGVYPPPRVCQWPESRDKPWRFCSARTVPGRPYCLAHCRRAYQGFGAPRSVRA